MPLNKRDIKTEMTMKPKGGAQWSLTVDGFHLASPSFRRRYDDAGFIGLEFRALASGYFDVRPQRRVDVLKQEVPWGDNISGHPSGLPILLTNHSGQCQSCGTFRHIRSYIGTVIGAHEPPVHENEFVGVNHLAGDCDAQSPHFIVGNAVHDQHKSKVFKGASIYHRAFHAGIDCVFP